MKRKELRAKIDELISTGTPKSEVFASLSGQGIKDRLLAYLIAVHVDPRRCEANRRRIKIMVAIAYVEMVITCLYSLVLGWKTSPLVGFLFAAVGTLISILFVWGFKTSRAGVYVAYFSLFIMQLPNMLMKDLPQRPLVTLVSLVINVSIVLYVLDLKRRLFPDLGLFSPRRDKGRYVFTD